MDRDVALVTGAGSGIGRAVARRLSERGAHVVAGDISESVRDAATELQGDGVHAAAVVGSVTDEDVLQRTVATALDFWGSLDTVAACAGIEVVGDAPNVRIDGWQRALDVKLTGTFVTARTIPGPRSDVVCPSSVETTMMHRLLGDDPAAANFYRRIIPLGPFAPPEEGRAHTPSPTSPHPRPRT